MAENLVIVESPAKAKTIEKFLGKGYTVKSSFGNIRDLSMKGLGIDIENGFKPEYGVTPDKKKVVSELAKLAENASTVWLASDEDREGEAIAWHLFESLKLKPENTKRIVFHEITKNAILNAIENPRDIDMNLVMAQQARRVLDRLVGFELSPVLWKKIQPKLSAGRVQSVALKLIVDREREIIAFDSQRFWKVEATFSLPGSRTALKTVLDNKFDTEEEARAFLEKCKGETFSVTGVETKEATRTPAAPFTTSTLQQEAARKLGFSVSQTMTVAQQLYEAGLITYMRTDSTNLSSLAINTAKDAVKDLFGAQYSKVRNYRTKSKGAQEAHEAIRPTYISNTDIEGSAAEKKLYNLIWKRTIACQMADAKIEKTIVSISGSNLTYNFIAEGEKIIFDGFLKVYIEGRDDEQEEDSATLPDLGNGEVLDCRSIIATEKFTQRPPRFSEASLVKKLEELGIGRPSTYAPTITTLIKRGYIIKGDKPGTVREYKEITLEEGLISEKTKKETVGSEKKKLLPENIGIVVTDFLAANFKDILDYGFTAKVEEDFDRIASGKVVWNKFIGAFYKPFHKEVDESLTDKNHSNAQRVLGTDPESGKVITARIGRFGPLVQKGANDDPDKQFVSLPKGQLIETITLEEALELFSLPHLPRTVGTYNGNEIVAAKGKFGPYVRYGSKFVSLGKTLDPYTVTLEQAISLIEASAEKEKNKTIAQFEGTDIQVLNGRYGPYIKEGKNNYKIPRGTKAESLTLEDCRAIIAQAATAVSKKK